MCFLPNKLYYCFVVLFMGFLPTNCIIFCLLFCCFVHFFTIQLFCFVVLFMCFYLPIVLLFCLLIYQQATKFWIFIQCILLSTIFFCFSRFSLHLLCVGFRYEHYAKHRPINYWTDQWCLFCWLNEKNILAFALLLYDLESVDYILTNKIHFFLAVRIATLSMLQL
jgi:hypothetical protein